MPAIVDTPLMIPAFHRLARRDRIRPYRWWRPLLEIAVAAALFVALQAVWVVAFILINGKESIGRIADGTPTSMLVGFGALAMTVPAAFAAAWASGRDVRALWSVERRFRWRYFLPALAVFAAPGLLTLGADIAIYGAPPAPLDPTFFWSVAIVLSLVPLQCLAEELLFRGVVVQSFGAWMRSPWLAYLLALPIFVVGHTAGGGGMLTIVVFALIASLLVHRSGGIELSVALHIVNNVTVSYAKFSGLIDLESARVLLSVVGQLGAFALALIALPIIGSKVAPMPTTDAHLRTLPHPTGDLLFNSSAGPEHGGVPVVAPWFAQTLGPQMHGWARALPWVITEETGETTTAELSNDRLRLIYTVRRGPEPAFTLRAVNEDEESRRIQLALHPYWAVDTARARVTGLADQPYFDKVAGEARRIDGDLAFGREVDSVVRTTNNCMLIDGHRALTFRTQGTDHVVVWNPGPEECAAADGLRADDWTRFVCVEPALLGENREGVELAPGASAELSLTVTATSGGSVRA
ncbi:MULTISPECIES: CPBP family glutamic-type intramembrane protease [Corynebacterium]|uniref:CAAX prenyl protease 2/Lysostaphin resistance protein A-like domain-containing protein n=1 Tax=Corynebacterium hadale TaxID=2026255 RepID=A0A269PFH5_9CORY|nr:CPBP family glutamic-type intramembrane protease [Corynebacterium hadale]PAJ71001.1 hypothetical protein CIG21_02160 [Corynebacterium hadale]